MEYSVQVVDEIKRQEQVDGLDFRYWYRLLGRTPGGTRTYFNISAQLKVFDGKTLIAESFELSPVTGHRLVQCRQQFERIALSPEPVSPVHLVDILRDLQPINRPQWWSKAISLRVAEQ